MRTQQSTKIIRVTEEVYNRIVEDRNHFEKLIGGGSWSMNDTIAEYHKILNLMEKIGESR